MRIVPALFIKEGKAAIYKAGNFKEIEFLNEDPYDIIARLDKLDIGHIGLVDVDASQGKSNNAGLIGSLANTTVATLHVGGGINDLDYLKSLQYAGLDFFIIGSAVHEQPALLKTIAAADHIKNERISIAIDICDGKLYYHGWKDDLDVSLNHFMQEAIDLGFSRFLLTDVTTDTASPLPDVAFYQSLKESFPHCNFVAAGRIDSFADIDALATTGVDAVVAGNKIYKDDNLLKQVADYNKRKE
jgi:phosphoribosylformimino-5-aminoimidazole carboxamide ribotide isomerase